MANPTKYVPTYSYSGFQGANPTKPLPAPRVDDDFANISRSINEAIAALADIRRSDGRLQNGSVGPDTLSPTLKIGFTFRGLWIQGEKYVAGDGVVHEGVFYSAARANTATEQNAPGDDTYWTELFSVDDLVVSGALSMPVNRFTGDGTQLEFELDFTPVTAKNLLITIGGVPQETTQYGTVGNKLTFNEPPPEGYSIEVRGFATLAVSDTIVSDTVIEGETNLFMTPVERTKLSQLGSPRIKTSNQAGLIGDGDTMEGAKILEFAELLTEGNLNDLGRAGRMNPGIYVCEKQIVVEMGGRNALAWKAEGRNLTKIVFTNPNDCGFKFLYPRQSGIARVEKPSLEFENISLLSLFERADIAGGGPIAGKAFAVAFDNGIGAAASASPGLSLKGLTIDSRTDEEADTSYGSWEVYLDVKGINFIDCADLVTHGMHTGSLAVDLSTSSDLISVQHNFSFPRALGKNAKYMRVTSENQPLQGVVIAFPNIVIKGGDSRGFELKGDPAGSLHLADQFAVVGGHVAVDGVALDAFGWDNVNLQGVYMLGAQIAANMKQCKNFNTSCTFSARNSDTGARAVIMDNCAQDYNRNSNIHGAFDSYTLSPVWLKGTTSRVFTTGHLSSQSSGVSSPQNLVQDDSTGSALNTHFGVSNDRLSAKTPPASAAGEEPVTAAWHIKDALSVNSQAVYGAAGSNSIPSADVGKLCIVLPGVTGVVFPNPATFRLGKILLVKNATGGALPVSASGGTVDGGSIPAGKDRMYVALGSNWSSIVYG